ncbi:PREDICTED: 65-kDa microtubule-associated protein 9-like [Camelina sativa]|uniref:65-kDa microtubule-associated protein 9-like n=1 Tax=Camelina sativa TaxID=90675 RepID=A0ABM1QNN5_CAMSA|nr:PREDICTED: 65-kDa microtubule-associated protein 9-like [Camelina sativa]
MSKTHIESVCASLLQELEIIWEEVGETKAEREKILIEIEDECRNVYGKKIEKVKEDRVKIRQEIADSEARVVAICSVMEEPPVLGRQQSDQSGRSLKEELVKILQKLEDMEKRKSERKIQFIQVIEDIRCVRYEINGDSDETCSSDLSVDESDLSLRKLEELHRELYTLQEQKRNRVKQIQDHLRTLESLCSVLGLNFRDTVTKVHPSLVESEGSRSISNETLNKLASLVKQWHETKIQRMQELQDLVMTMLEFWNLMDTPAEEQQKFMNVSCNIAATVSEITRPNSLSIDLLQEVKDELCRLEELKWSKMKELVLKKRSELEDICRRTHIVLEEEEDIAVENVIKAIESGDVNPEYILEQIEYRAGKVKEEALSRKEILEKTEKWLSACEEENWLEEYNQDENRYNAGKGSHIILKRAEKARALVNKLPAMVEALASKITIWESEKESEFLFDGNRLLLMLEDYTELREEKEQERRRKRDLKKLQGQVTSEQDKASVTKPQSAKKGLKVSTNKRFVSSPQTPRTDSPMSAKSITTPQSRHG